MNEPHIRSVPRVTVHYIQMQPTVEVLLQVRTASTQPWQFLIEVVPMLTARFRLVLQVDPALTVDEASAVAARVRQAVETLPDVMRAEVHLDLTGR